MLGDLTQQDGRAILHVQDPNAHNYESWCKLVNREEAHGRFEPVLFRSVLLLANS